MKVNIKLFSYLFLVFMLVSVKAWGAVCLAGQAGFFPSAPSAQTMQVDSEHGFDSQGADHEVGFDCFTACVNDAAVTLSVDDSGIESQRTQSLAVAASLPIVHRRDFSDRILHGARHRYSSRHDILLRTQRTRC